MLYLNDTNNVTKIVTACSYKILLMSPLFIRNTTLRIKMGRPLPRDTQRLSWAWFQDIRFPILPLFWAAWAFTSIRFWVKFYFPLLNTIRLELHLLRIKHLWESTYSTLIYCLTYNTAHTTDTLWLNVCCLIHKYALVSTTIHPRVHKYSIIHAVIYILYIYNIYYAWRFKISDLKSWTVFRFLTPARPMGEEIGDKKALGAYVGQFSFHLEGEKGQGGWRVEGGE